MTTNYKAQEKQIHQIIRKNITCLKAERYVKVIIYYRNRKLRNLFIRNSRKVKEEFDVVYCYSCNKKQCNGTQSYARYTTTLLSTRMDFHAQQGSIRKHHMETHNKKITKQEILANITIVKKCNQRHDLNLAEALYIKSLNPSLNAQNNFSTRTLKIF